MQIAIDIFALVERRQRQDEQFESQMNEELLFMKAPSLLLLLERVRTLFDSLRVVLRR
jgi:hypothetical protein